MLLVYYMLLKLENGHSVLRIVYLSTNNQGFIVTLKLLQILLSSVFLERTIGVVLH